MKFKEYLPLSIEVFFLNLGLILFNILGWVNFPAVFALFCLAVFLLAFKKPQWIFWIFVALLPLENIIITPVGSPISLRPYQVTGAILSVVLIVLWLAGKSTFRFISFRKICLVCKVFSKEGCPDSHQQYFGFFDRLVFVFPFFALLGILAAPDKGLAAKGALILFSFVLLFWLARNFLQSNRQKLEALWFFSLGAVPVVFFAIYQAIASGVGWQSFEVFQGRINGTFAEPDWFGMYLVFLFAIELWCLLLLNLSTNTTMIGYIRAVTLGKIAAHLDLFLISSLMLLTVSRSAWIAAVIVVFAYIGANFWFTGKRKDSLSGIFAIAAVGAAALFVVVQTGLFTFHFGNRAASSVTGMQKITISCESSDSSVPDKIENVALLAKYDCKHINLEEIEEEKNEGNFVKEIYRPDPNVDIRKELYAKTWEEIKKYPLTGIGVGSAQIVLGFDSQGSGYNASNIFLEIWLSMGLFALLIFVFVVFAPLVKLLRGILDNPKSKNAMRFGSFALVSFGAIVVPNFFNSGLLIGFLWIWLALMLSFVGENEKQKN